MEITYHFFMEKWKIVIFGGQEGLPSLTIRTRLAFQVRLAGKGYRCTSIDGFSASQHKQLPSSTAWTNTKSTEGAKSTEGGTK